ncbi:MAG: hypothetical protein WAN43_00560 [Rhodomicrobium sp.]
MSSHVAVVAAAESFTVLPALVERAADRLMHAKSSAEILEAANAGL